MPLQVQARRLWAPLALAAASLAAAIIVACSGGSNGTETPSPSPQTPTDASPIAGTTTPTPLPPLDPTAYRFLYSEFGTDSDTIWSVSATDPSERVMLATVAHGTGWAIEPALSPDGTKIAYNVMPQQASFPATDAQTQVLDITTGETELVAERVDLRTTPRWSPDGGLLFLRRNVGEEITVILVEISRPEDGDGAPEPGGEDGPPPVRTVLRQHVSDVLAYAPLGVDPEEATLYFVQIQGGTESGSYLGRYAPATGEAVATATAIADATATAAAATATAAAATATPTATSTPSGLPTPTPTPALFGDVFLILSDQIIRDYSLSPDASSVAFLVPGLVAGQFVSRTHIAKIDSPQVSLLASPEGLSPGDQLNPVWHPEGDKISVGQLPAGANPGRVAIVPLDGGAPTFLPSPEQGFDEPLSWSPDGKFLALSSSSGESIGNPGASRLVIVSPAGQRFPVLEGAEVRSIGWIKGSE